MNNDWLQELKAGDEVIVDAHNTGRSIQIVARVTATQITLEGRIYGWMKFSRADGEQRGERYYRAKLLEATPELKAVVLAERRRIKLIGILDGTKWTALTLTQLETIATLLEVREDK